MSRTFLSYNSKEKTVVQKIAQALEKRGVRVWFDEWHLIPGRAWQEEVERTIARISAVLVFIGRDGLGPWQDREMRSFLARCVRRQIPIVPVLLPGAPKAPELPLFLSEFTWVDLREGLRKTGINRLIWGIRGRKPSAAA